MGEKRLDRSMDRVRTLFERSGLTLEELGLKMGYPQENARQSAFQFMKAGDPRISMLRRFAAALEVPLSTLVDEAEDGKAKRKRGKGR